MTAAPFVGWQRQDERPLGAGRRSRTRSSTSAARRVTVHGAGRTDAGVHALGQVAHFDLVARDERRRRCAMRSTSICGRTRSRCCRRRGRAGGFPRAVLGHGRAPIAIASSTAARRWRSSAAASGRCSRRSTPRRCTRRRSACRAARFHHLPRQLDLPGELAGEDARSRSRSRALGEEIDIEAARALVPASPGAQHGRHAEAGGRGQVERRDVAAALAARDRAKGGPTAPPEGLYLVEVRYCDRAFSPSTRSTASADRRDEEGDDEIERDDRRRAPSARAAGARSCDEPADRRGWRRG